MRYRLKDTTAKKLKEQLYLGLFFAFILWVLMAFLFLGDSPQTIVLYLIGSAIIIPLLYKKHVKPFFDNLKENTRNAFIELDDQKVIFNHFSNIKQFDQQQIEFQISDIVNLKKAFRKDDSVNKITLTVKNPRKVKIVVEDFDNMEQMAEDLLQKIAAHGNRAADKSSNTG